MSAQPNDPPRPEITPPPGQRIPIDPRHLPKRMPLEVGRRYDPGHWEYTVPDVLPVGGIVLYARPGAGKTRLAMQWEQCVAYRVPFAGYAPEDGGRVLVADFENGMHMAITASIDLAPFGTVEWDEAEAPAQMIDYDTEFPGIDFAARFVELSKRLREAAEAGAPYRLVRIDTLRAFISPYPQGANTYQWEAACLVQLNNLALELGLSIVIVHHTNKVGEVSGSTGIEGSFTTAYKLERQAGGDEGKLYCTKNRVGPELHWDALFVDGAWEMTKEISKVQAESTGTQRRILDYLAGEGPSKVEAIREALADVKPKTVSDLLSRLHSKGWVSRGNAGTWAIASGGSPASAPARPARPAPARLRAVTERSVVPCAVCGEAMEVLEPGQGAHPGCDPEGKVRSHPSRGAQTREAGEDQAGDVAAAAEPGDLPAGEDPPDQCPVCGVLRTVADTHPDCVVTEVSSASWPAFEAMKSTLKESRMHPIPWIPPAGHPKAKPGMQTRDMPAWKAAEMADIGAFHWTRPGLLEEFGPDALISTTDRNQSYISSTSSVPVAPNLLVRTGPLEAHPKLLGDVDPRTGKPTGLAGVVRLVCPEWPDPRRMAHPLGRHAVPGEPMVVASGALEDLWRLHEQGQIGRPEVLDSFMGRRNTSLFEPYGKRVRIARAQYADDELMTIAVKRSSSIAIRALYPKSVNSPFWRPDWYAALVSQAMFRLWIQAWKATQSGAVVAGLGSVDEVSFVIPAGTEDPAAWLPEPFKYGAGWGEVKPKPITVRADRADLSGIDPARITPSKSRPGYVSISGPVPLSVWMVKRRA